jgi:hypothetical protein
MNWNDISEARGLLELPAVGSEDATVKEWVTWAADVINTTHPLAEKLLEEVVKCHRAIESYLDAVWDDCNVATTRLELQKVIDYKPKEVTDDDE